MVFASYLFCTTSCLLQPTVSKLEITTQQLELPFSSTQEFSAPGEIAHKLSMLGEGLSNIGISSNIPPLSLQTACLYVITSLETSGQPDSYFSPLKERNKDKG